MSVNDGVPAVQELFEPLSAQLPKSNSAGPVVVIAPLVCVVDGVVLTK